MSLLNTQRRSNEDEDALSFRILIRLSYVQKVKFIADVAGLQRVGFHYQVNKPLIGAAGADWNYDERAKLGSLLKLKRQKMNQMHVVPNVPGMSNNMSHPSVVYIHYTILSWNYVVLEKETFIVLKYMLLSINRT